MGELASRTTLTAIQRYVARFLKSECTITRAVVGKDVHGSPTKTYDPVASNVPCRVITQRGTASAQAMRIGARETLVDMYRLIVSTDTDVRQDDQIIVGDATYEVASIDDKLTDRVFKGVVLTRERSRNAG